MLDTGGLAQRPCVVDFGINTKPEFDATVVTLKVYWHSLFNEADFHTDFDEAIDQIKAELDRMLEERKAGQMPKDPPPRPEGPDRGPDSR